jgi:serine/threonine-protein kinase
MGVVWKARHEITGQLVAVKVMSASLSGSSSAKARFLRESRLVTELRHPSIVRVLDVGLDEERAYMVMELLDGNTLSEVLAHEEKLSVEKVVEILLPVLSAVASVHRRGIVHRDLKPANLMLVRENDGAVKPMLLDFGISTAPDGARDESGLTQSHALLGTLRYLAPEQVLNAKASSAASDLYSVGVIAYECVTGRRPFGGSSSYELMHAILNADVVSPTALVSDLPRGFEGVVLKAMHRDPSLRFPDARALGAALLAFAAGETWTRWAREFLGSAPELAEPTIPDADVDQPVRASTTRSAPFEIARPRIALVGAVLVLAALVVSGASYFRTSHPGDSEQRSHEAPQPRAEVTRPATSQRLRTEDVQLPSATSSLAARAASSTSVDAGAPRPKRSRAARSPALSPPTTRRAGALGEDDVIDPFATS